MIHLVCRAVFVGRCALKLVPKTSLAYIYRYTRTTQRRQDKTSEEKKTNTNHIIKKNKAIEKFAVQMNFITIDGQYLRGHLGAGTNHCHFFVITQIFNHWIRIKFIVCINISICIDWFQCILDATGATNTTTTTQSNRFFWMALIWFWHKFSNVVWYWS